MFHEIYPIAREFYNAQSIPESHWKICQCGKLHDIIKQNEWKFKVGLEELIPEGAGKRSSGGYYLDLVININNRLYTVQLLAMLAGEIAKSTRPGTRKKRIATGTFYDGTFIQELGTSDAGPYYVQWKLKTEFTHEKVKLNKHVVKNKNLADWWYQNWSVHGLREEADKDLHTKQFVGIHNNIFVGGTSREECEKRIVLYVYAGEGAPEIETMEINGIRLKTKKECETKENNKQQHRNNNNNVKHCGLRMEENCNSNNSQLSQYTNLQESFMDQGGLSLLQLNNNNSTDTTSIMNGPPQNSQASLLYTSICNAETVQWKNKWAEEQATNEVLKNHIINQEKLIQSHHQKILNLENENNNLINLLTLIMSEPSQNSMHNGYNGNCIINTNGLFKINSKALIGDLNGLITTTNHMVNLHDTLNPTLNLNANHHGTNANMGKSLYGAGGNLMANFIKEYDNDHNEPSRKRQKLNHGGKRAINSANEALENVSLFDIINNINNNNDNVCKI